MGHDGDCRTEHGDAATGYESRPWLEQVEDLRQEMNAWSLLAMRRAIGSPAEIRARANAAYAYSKIAHLLAR